MYYYHPHTGRFEQSTRTYARSSYGGRSYDDDALYIPFRPHYVSSYDSSRIENDNRSFVNRELLLSTAAMEDNYDISTKSRNRDRDVLAAANRAIVDTELHSSPRSAVAARRAMRGRSVPPTPTYTAAVNKTEFVPQTTKPIRDVDGVKKPNILSWQYRLDALVSPDDLIVVPRSLASVKSQVREVQDKMDRHRQLMDRYLNTDTGLTVDDQRTLAASKAHLDNRN